MAERSRDLVESILLTGADLATERIERSGGAAGRPRPPRVSIAEKPEVRATYELRYEGQAFELPIDGEPRPDPAELRRAFDRAHEDRYGYADPGANLELVTIRVAVALPGAEPRPAEWDGPSGIDRSTAPAQWCRCPARRSSSQRGLARPAPRRTWW